RWIIFAKKAGGYQILIGLGLLVFLFFIASFLKLEMILSVISILKDYWLLVIIILFQPEIRSTLAKISHTNIFSPFQKSPKKSIYAPLTNAVDTMSFLKKGALIIIENKIKLNKFIETGEKIDAVLSSKLLTSIFDRNSILHDGAVIIRNDRIEAVKVVLPLSQNIEYRRQFGTRHLAAIGITEESDALAIVVSEETGKISVAINGIIQTDINVEMLSQIVADSTK
ncbi:MAG: diadenylate cyclase CdaA, partial [Candidatus Pacebacteria bacterium]|nr:diadenylate cyclase CdaA [Candidatus Paceibacterota bacterium]